MRAALVSVCAFALFAGCGGPSKAPTRTPEQLVEQAMKAPNARILEDVLTKIPPGTPGRENAEERLVEVRKAEAEKKAAAAAEAERRTKAAQEKKRKAEEAYLKSPAGRVHTKHPTWSREICAMVANEEVQIGMTDEQVRASWGRPDRVNRTVTARGTHEQWVYGMRQYVYFEDGVMTSLQTSH